MTYTQLEEIHQKELSAQKSLVQYETLVLCDSIWEDKYKKRLAIVIDSVRISTTRIWRDSLLPRALDSLKQIMLKNQAIEKKQFGDSLLSVAHRIIDDTVKHFNMKITQLKSGFFNHFMTCELRYLVGPIYAKLSASSRKNENRMANTQNQPLEKAFKDKKFKLTVNIITFCLGFLLVRLIVQLYRKRVKNRFQLKSWH